MRRLHIVYIGQVQGVGFRWTAQSIARELGLTGWVRNESDGSVTLELQGPDALFPEFFGRFDRSYARYPIEYVIDEKKEMAVVDGEDEFRVRFNRG